MSTDTTRRVVALMQPVLDDVGAEGWLDRPRRQLGDLTPRQLLDLGQDTDVPALALALRCNA